jgi:hypothetical protein
MTATTTIANAFFAYFFILGDHLYALLGFSLLVLLFAGFVHWFFEKD